jgi:hypothetical protein
LLASALRSANVSGATGIVLLNRRADFVRLVDAGLASGAATRVSSDVTSTCSGTFSLRADAGFGADIPSRPYGVALAGVPRLGVRIGPTMAIHVKTHSTPMR